MRQNSKTHEKKIKLSKCDEPQKLKVDKIE